MKPLRSDDEPLGFSWLSGVDKTRVDSANVTYLHTCELIELAYSFNIVSLLENPANSIFWLIPCVVRHGIFDELAAECEKDGSQQHLDWKPVTSDKKLQYPTAAEAAYPFLLCQRLVDTVKRQSIDAGALEPQNLQEQIELEDKNSYAFILGMLPRGKKFRQLVSEFEHYIECYIKPSDDTMLNKFLSPKGSRTTNRLCLTWGEVRFDSTDKQYICR